MGGVLIDDPGPIDVRQLKQKSLSLHWELMFTRSMFETDDMIAQHRLLTEMAELRAAGAVAFSDDGSYVTNGTVMRRALEYASMVGLPVISHCEDPDLVGSGVMNEGLASTLAGLRPVPAAAEEVAVARDIILAKLTGARLRIRETCCGVLGVEKPAADLRGGLRHRRHVEHLPCRSRRLGRRWDLDGIHRGG